MTVRKGKFKMPPFGEGGISLDKVRAICMFPGCGKVILKTDPPHTHQVVCQSRRSMGKLEEIK